MRRALLLLCALLWAVPASAQPEIDASRLYLGVSGSVCPFITGSGSPESVVTAPVCAVYVRTDGALGTMLWLKTSGAGSTGWQVMSIAAPGAAGTVLRSDGSAWAASTTIWPNSGTSTRVPYWSASNTLGESANLTFDGSQLTVGGLAVSSRARSNTAGEVGVAQVSTAGWGLRLNTSNVLAVDMLDGTWAQSLTLTRAGALGVASLALTTPLPLASGGTAANLTAVNGGIAYSGASAMALSAAGSSGQVLRSGGAGAPTWSTATFPSTATTSGAYLRADGTNWITSTLVLPNSITSGYIPYATGTNTIGSGSGLTYSGSAFAVTGTGTFTGSVTANVTDAFKSTVSGDTTFTGFSIVNTSALGSAQARIVVGNDTSAVALALVVSSSTAAPAGWLPVNTGAARSVLSGGLSLVATHASGDVRVYNRGGTLAATWGASGALTNVGTLAFGGGAALDSSTKVVMTDTTQTLSGAKTFSAVLAANAGITVDSTAFTVADTTGNTSIAGTLGVTGQVNVTASVLPTINWTTNVGSQTLKLKKLFAAELEVDTLVAQDVLATIGGEIITAPTTTLQAAITDAATTISVAHSALANGDRIWMEARGNFEMMAITSAPSGAGPYSYTVTRNLDGSGANAWIAGDAIVNTGTTGDGYIHQYATSGTFAGTGPTMVGQVRTGTGYNNIATRWAIGNLNGLYDYGADTYGAAFGDATAANVTVDASNGFRVRHSTTNRLALNTDGSGMLANSSIAWDVSGNLTVTGNTTLGGWSIGADYIRDASGTVGLSSAVTGGDDIRFWAGDATMGSAEFRVTEAGVLTATNATITSASGTITINDTGIAAASNGSGYAEGSSYRFTPATIAGTTYGLYGFEPGGGLGRRYLTMENISTADEAIYANISADNSATSVARVWVSACPSDAGGDPYDGYIGVCVSSTSYAGLTADRVLLTGATGVTGTLETSGLASLNAGIAVDSTAFTVADVTGNTAIGGTLSVTGLTTISGAIKLTSTSSPTQLTANTDNWSLSTTARFFRVSADAARDLTGIVAMADGTEIIIWNGGSYAITLKHDNASSTAANRFLTPGGTDYALGVYQSVLLRYSSTDARWIILG